MIVDQTGGAAACFPYNGKDKHFVTRPITVTLTPDRVTGDVIKAIPVKKGWLVKGVISKTVQAAAGAAVVTLNAGVTGGDVDGFDVLDGLSVAGTVKQSIPADGYPALGGFMVTADGTIDILCATITGVITTPAIFTVQAEVLVTD